MNQITSSISRKLKTYFSSLDNFEENFALEGLIPLNYSLSNIILLKNSTVNVLQPITQISTTAVVRSNAARVRTVNHSHSTDSAVFVH